MSFEKAGSEYEQWREIAYALKLAAIATANQFAQLTETAHQRPDPWEGAETGYVALMLGGLALENLAKALLVRRDATLTAELAKGRLPKRLESHKITSLLSDGGFALSAQEATLVSELERFVVWAGRYPIPVLACGERLVKIYRSHDMEHFVALYDRLDRAVTVQG